MDEIIQLKLDGYICFINNDFSGAAKAFNKVSSYGDPDVQYYLGYLYENGLGVVENQLLAFEFYEKSASQGLAKSQYVLANFS
ncbi:tetratricopeptide repeat protein [Vibrio mimicus]